jgi:hypothetical protein
MATKAQRFRYTSERSGPKEPKKKTKTPRGRGKMTGASTGERNRSLHAARKEGVLLEDSQTKPSRKSTRKAKGRAVTVSANEQGVDSKRQGKGHVKTASNLTLRATLERRSSQERAQRGRRPARGSAPAR